MFAAAWRPRVRQEGLAERARIFSNCIVSWLVFVFSRGVHPRWHFLLCQSGWLVDLHWMGRRYIDRLVSVE